MWRAATFCVRFVAVRSMVGSILDRRLQRHLWRCNNTFVPRGFLPAGLSARSSLFLSAPPPHPTPRTTPALRVWFLAVGFPYGWMLISCFTAAHTPPRRFRSSAACVSFGSFRFQFPSLSPLSTRHLRPRSFFAFSRLCSLRHVSFWFLLRCSCYGSFCLDVERFHCTVRVLLVRCCGFVSTALAHLPDLWIAFGFDVWLRSRLHSFSYLSFLFLHYPIPCSYICSTCSLSAFRVFCCH